MNLSLSIVTRFDSIDPQDWDRLNHDDNPFLSHAFLAGLEASGSIGTHVGWQPHHLVLFQGDTLVAAAPTYIKTNSHGEFVFDWAWADAYHRHSLPYYPKLLTAVPYSPVTGRRLLTQKGHPEAEQLRKELISQAINQCEQLDLSSWHCNFMQDEDHRAGAGFRLLDRSDWQFHWRNRNYASFDEFMAQLRSRKRKNIRRERRNVASAGIQFEWKSGGEIDSADSEFIHQCYT
ncbi:MAG: GNAT family N-acetyltransferase, partial [Xanthomonadales bacterium]|nr:GNAT family N-acetyltransferase [Xanthomonadales bacterium]